MSQQEHEPSDVWYSNGRAYCKYCGTERPEGVFLCSNCGPGAGIITSEHDSSNDSTQVPMAAAEAPSPETHGLRVVRWLKTVLRRP